MLKRSRMLLVSSIVSGLIVATLLGIGVVRCGSPSNFFRFLSGKRLVIDLVETVSHDNGYLPEKLKTNGNPRPGPPTSHTFKLRLRNLSGERIEVIGRESTCSCMLTSDLPEAVDPWSAADFTVWAAGGEWPGQQMFIHTTSPYEPTVAIAFSR